MSLSYLELAGLLTGIAGVVLTIRQIIWSWPAGLISVMIYVYVFYESRLYSDMALQVVYILFCVYGWYQWKFGGVDKEHALPVSRWSGDDLYAGILWLIGFTGLQYLLLSFYTNADFPFWDALLTSGSLWATYLMARKRIECWLLWIAVDAGYVLLYYAKHLHVTMLLYSVFVALAYKGWIDWNKEFKKEEA